jgi:hypothetical protein
VVPFRSALEAAAEVTFISEGVLVKADGERGEGDFMKFEITGEAVTAEEPGRSEAAGPFDVHAVRNGIKKVAKRKRLNRGRIRLHLISTY